jgi:hypothetical protein
MEIEVLEQSLREGLRQHAAEVPPGAGARLASLRDFHPNPYRYTGARWAVPVVAASTVVSAGVLSGMMATSGSGTGRIGSGPVGHLTPIDAQTVAYRTTAAVEAAAGSEIEHLHVSYGAGPRAKAVSEQWVYGSSWRSEQSAPGGTPLFGISEVARGCQTSVRAVDFTNKTWYEGPGGVLLAGPDDRFAQSDVADQIRHELADGQLRSVGSSEVAGQRALELNGVLSGNFEMGLPAGCRPPAIDAPLINKVRNAPPWDYTVWVNPSTYLPVQFSVTNDPAEGAGVYGSIEWLPADAQNRGQLVQPIPPGFTESASTVR